MFFDNYMRYVADTESPLAYHRWSAITAASAALGRRVSIPFGHFTFYPNMYTVLVGTPGSRKSSAINLAGAVLKKAGYHKFAADRTSKEKFLMDLQDSSDNKALIGIKGLKALDRLDMAALELNYPRELFIKADELADFLGQGNNDFITALGVLWDANDKYENRIKNGASTVIHNPCVSLLGGITPSSFATTFPADTAGQGFLSRLLLIYSDPSPTRIAWPTPPSSDIQDDLVRVFKELLKMRGKAEPSKEAKQLLSIIYSEYVGVEDGRFEHYNSRRHTHLLKLATIIAALDGTLCISSMHVRRAHTMLFYAEKQMPKALTDFGRNRNAAIAGIILVALNRALVPLTFQDLWKIVCNDLQKQGDLVDMLVNLQMSTKVQVVNYGTGNGYMAVNADLDVGWRDDLGDKAFLSKQEMGKRI